MAGLKSSIPQFSARACIAAWLLPNTGRRRCPPSSNANQSPFARRIAYMPPIVTPLFIPSLNIRRGGDVQLVLPVVAEENREDEEADDAGEQGRAQSPPEMVGSALHVQCA